MAVAVQKGSAVASWICVGLGLALGALTASGQAGAVMGAATAGADFTQNLSPGSWMAWTGAGALFFGVIAALLLAMIVWGAVAPETPRVGVLRIETTPGDRLFLSLLGSAFICLGWLALFGAPLWGGLSVSLLYAAAVFRWV
ncbi:DUF2160 domain-containing protein [Rubrimonas cliftonensis]|uniref:Predicted small integral membrane protein n=1 Tax=Rubrimonas cliftonensis TaxID=89524 RepID=A0A1H3YM39_9RHOB|nr:DUF2160 domain-containing protein [Rubrimonas cliftonensis]SEA12635.1 Predicted small integral membrane protein [Rubrimonas cliftonensis]